MNTNPITIRNLGPEEAHVLDNIRPGTVDTLDLSRTWALLATRINDLVVALDRGEVVGVAYGTMLMHPDRPSAFQISALAVHPEFRRQGIGKRLLRRLTELAGDRGCDTVWIAEDASNKALQGFCASLDGSEFLSMQIARWPT